MMLEGKKTLFTLHKLKTSRNSLLDLPFQKWTKDLETHLYDTIIHQSYFGPIIKQYSMQEDNEF
jgi:hypothetical protein